MPTRNRKGQFQKRSKARHHTSTAMTVAPRRSPVRRSSPRVVHVARRHRSRKHGGGIKLLHVGLAAAGIAFLTGDQSPIKAIPTNVAKIPGAATFGGAAALGGVCLVVNHFKPNKWLKLAGVAGIVLAAAKVGAQGTAFKYVGDEGSDVGDLEMGDDDGVGDYED